MSWRIRGPVPVAHCSFVKRALITAYLTDDEIEQKPWNYYKRRVRQRVPASSELKVEFKHVVSMLENVLDKTTGKPLFDDRAGNLCERTLKDRKRVQMKEDRNNGIPLFECIRGASALEGFHKKIRQLILGFNISPRDAIALLSEFIYRRNHEIDVRELGFPGKYSQYFDGWEERTRLR